MHRGRSVQGIRGNRLSHNMLGLAYQEAGRLALAPFSVLAGSSQPSILYLLPP